MKYDDFAGKTIHQIFGTELNSANILKATQLASTCFYNEGNGSFKAYPLPTVSQSAPVFAMLEGDFNRDGKVDILTGGNFSGVLPYEGRYDAMVPMIVWGSDQRQSAVNLPFEKSLLIKGEVRDIKKIRVAGKDAVIITRNNDSAVVLTW